MRMLFVDYSSAFNTIVPSKLKRKLQDLGSLCSWIFNFLSDRHQVVSAKWELLAIELTLEVWRHWLVGTVQPFIVWTVKP